MITPFPFIIWSLQPRLTLVEGVRVTILRCAPVTGPAMLSWKGVSCRAEAIDAACLLPIFKFSAPYGIRSVTSSKPLLRLTLCSLLKPKKPTSWSNSLFLQRSSVVNNESVLQTASHEYKPSWQQKASALLRCPWISESLPAVMAVTGGYSANK